MPKSFTRGRNKRKYRKRASQPYFKRGKKSSKAKKKVKRNAKRRRPSLTPAFQKKLKKVAKRVLTSMNDDKAVMYRQYVPPDASVPNPTPGQPALTLDSVAAIVDGAYVNSDKPALKMIVRREKTGFFQVDKYRGMLAPSWQEQMTGFDDNQNYDVGQPFLAGMPWNRVDIRAYREVELPFLPAIPAIAGGTTNFLQHNELEEYCRTNQKIKITNNYMKFKFFATANGQVGKFHIATNVYQDQNNDTGIFQPMIDDTNMEAVGRPAYSYQPGQHRMLGFNSNLEVVRQFGFSNMEHEHVADDVVNGGQSITKTGNLPLSYKITARRFAKVRIIVVERECMDDSPILLSDFMKYNSTTDWKNEFHYGSEELHQSKRFNSKKKTKRDLPFFQDTKMLEQKAKVKFLVDKVVNLPMGREKTVILNPLKGKVLEYEPVERSDRVTDVGADVSDETTGDANEELTPGLPVNINSVPVLTSVQQRNEYCPVNKQYAMFMLMNCQRAGIEYDIFQKFEYDK